MTGAGFRKYPTKFSPPPVFSCAVFQLSLPDTDIQKAVVAQELTQVEEEGQMLVHVTVRNREDMAVRIWPSTFLVDMQQGRRARLLQQFNISLAPDWTFIPGNSRYRFTLVFERLPKDCIMFDLLEIIPEPGGFAWHNILRNQQDVYWLNMEE
jgi:hypothetical protein